MCQGAPLDAKDMELRRVKAAQGELLVQFSQLQAARDSLATQLQEVDPSRLPPQPSVYPEAPSGIFKPINAGDASVKIVFKQLLSSYAASVPCEALMDALERLAEDLKGYRPSQTPASCLQLSVPVASFLPCSLNTLGKFSRSNGQL